MLSALVSKVAPLISGGYRYDYNYETSGTLDEAALTAFLGTYFLIICCSLVIGFLVYLYVAYCYSMMAENLGHSDMKILAFIPIANLYLLVTMAKKDPIWFIFMILPFVNFVALILVWLEILKRYNKDVVWLLLLFVPLVNFWVLWDLAHSKPVA